MFYFNIILVWTNVKKDGIIAPINEEECCMVNFKDLDEETIIRLQEIIVDDDINKLPYLLSRYNDGLDKLDDGEKIYLDWFLYFEHNVVDEVGNVIIVTNPYSDKDKEDVCFTLFNIMKAGFTLDYRAITNNGNLECIFVNRGHKSFVFMEMSNDESLIQQTRLIIPVKKNNDEVSLEVFNKLPSNLYKIMDKHHSREWPFMTVDHSSYFGNLEELEQINNKDISNIEKSRLVSSLDMLKLDKLPSAREVIGSDNMFLVK